MMPQQLTLHTREDNEIGRIGPLYEFRVYGEPMQYMVPNTRTLTYQHGSLLCVRISPKTGRAVTLHHVDKRVEKWEADIAKQIRAALISEFDPILSEGPVWMELWIFVTRPKSVTSMFPDKQPDRTNFLKSSEDGLEAGLRHDLDYDVKGKVSKSLGFNDGQVVDGPTRLRWAYMNYPDCGRQEPGLIIRLQRMDCSLEKELNRDYRAFLKAEDFEYVTELYGRKKQKKRTVLRKGL